MPSYIINVVASSRVLVVDVENEDVAKDYVYDHLEGPYALDDLDVLREIVDDDVNTLEQEKKHADQII